jgi:hypothetical protein
MAAGAAVIDYPRATDGCHVAGSGPEPVASLDPDTNAEGSGCQRFARCRATIGSFLAGGEPAIQSCADIHIPSCSGKPRMAVKSGSYFTLCFLCLLPRNVYTLFI